jgi:hypothetical protein
MNSKFTYRKRMPTGFSPFVLAVVLSIASSPVQAQVFQWQENSWPAEDMNLSKVAASAERLIAVGRTGTSPDFAPVAVTSTDGRNWQIVDVGLAGRFVSDILHTEQGFILALEDGSLRIGDPDQGWDEIVPPDEARLRLASVVEHQGRILLFGQLVSNFRTSRIVATADFLAWDLLWEGSDLFVGPFLIDPISNGTALAMSIVFGPPAFPIAGLLYSSDGIDWEGHDDGFRLAPTSIATRQGTLFARTRETSGNIHPLRILQRGPGDVDWQPIIHPDFLVNSSGLIRGGPPGLVLQVTIDGQQALLAGVDGSSWTRQGFTPSGLTQDFVAWQGGWVGVGDTALLGRPQGSVPVPTISIPGLLLLALGLLALARFSRRQRAA